ncbi:MAG TPA: metallophosphoesterase [Gemmatimonadales bacterium]|nr:metallophosphoesterase [Gemmatimonadales bacterium]
MSAAPVLIAHLSDLHFGGYADLAQIEALEEFLPTLGAAAAVVSGDLTQRARHGEFQAAHGFVHRIRSHTPVLLVPGNHDIEWWKSPLGLLGRERKFGKYARYFGDLTPVLEVPGARIAGALSSYGVAFGSLTWNLRDLAVKGHLPRNETDRIQAIFAEAPPDVVRVLVFHHNVLPGASSRRMGLARWRSAHRRLLATGADVILCGHDHQEGAGQIEGALAVSTSGTHSSRSRGGRPSVFNLVKTDSRAVHIQHFRWEPQSRRFLRSDTFSFARTGPPRVAVSVAGGDQGL